MKLNLEGTNTREDFLAKVKARVAQTEPGKWITGRGWIETFWKPPKFPTREDLDKIAPENPVLLTRADGHAAVVNSAALKIAGIDQRYRESVWRRNFEGQQTGDPTGMLLDNAQDSCEKNIPKPTEAERAEALLRGIEREIKLGWCEIQNAGSRPGRPGDYPTRFDAKAKSSCAFTMLSVVPGRRAECLLKDGATLNAYDHHFTQRTIKVIFDGALGSRGAALLDPYTDRPTLPVTSGRSRRNYRRCSRKRCAAAFKSKRTPSAIARIE